jgi:hypothetical protein
LRIIVDDGSRTLLRFWCNGRAIQQRPTPTSNRCDGCFQIVRDIGHKIPLCLSGGVHLCCHLVEVGSHLLHFFRAFQAQLLLIMPLSDGGSGSSHAL